MKREKAGAISEIKKDAAFIAREKKKQDDKRDAAGAKKVAAFMHTLQEQQRDSNILRGKTKAPQTKKDRRAQNTKRTFRP